MTRQQIFSTTFLVLCLGLLGLLGLLLHPFLLPILWAVVLTRICYPLYRRLLVLLRGQETLAAALLTLAVMALLIAPVVYVVLLAVQESLDAYQTVASWAEAGGLRTLTDSIAEWPVMGRLSQEVLGRLIVNSGEVEANLLEAGRAVSSFVLTHVANMGRRTVLFVTNFFVMLFTLFFLLRDGQHFYARLYRALPLEEAHKARLFDQLDAMVVAVVIGTLATAGLQGLVAGITYFLLDIPFAAFLGVLSALFALFPVGGTALVWGPLVLYLLAAGLYGKALILLVIGGGLVGLMDNLLQPFLIGSQARLPVLFLFFATVGGIALFGFLGLILGPVVFAAVMATLQIYEEEYEDKQAELLLPGNGAPSHGEGMGRSPR